MKQYFLILFFLSALFLIGCSNDSAPTGTGGGIGGGGTGGGGGGTGSVTFTIGQKAGAQGEIIFTASPSTAVTVTSFTVSLPAQQFTDPNQGDGQTVFQSGQFYELSAYTGVASGQQWTFNFKGNIGSAQGQAYDVTANYTVP